MAEDNSQNTNNAVAIAEDAAIDNSTNPLSNTHRMCTRSKAGIHKPKLPYIGTAERHEEEFKALIANDTWTLVPPQGQENVIDSKWVFKTKYKVDGTVERRKAMLVAKGFQQIAGLDFDETFSPVIKASTVRIILAIAVHFNWEVRQMDINNAFLNGYLKETIFMPQPEGFVDPNKPLYVCKLTKAIYGLKQAPRAWFDRLKIT